ncbi:MAG: 16S rRNA (guanine(966)-N(2))-methyltransferase RsmD [Bacteroidales bacterium]
MRIVSGNYKGRVLKLPKDLPVRPTTDMAREALFNILNSNFYIDEMDVLDLFSGTGAISFEFVSRGANQVICVEKNALCVDSIKSNSKILDITNIQVLKTDVFKFLGSCRRSFDIVFADPPFVLTQEEYEQIYTQVIEKKLLKENSWLILEHSKDKDFSHLPYFHEIRKYGKVHFSIFENSIEESEEQSE